MFILNKRSPYNLCFIFYFCWLNFCLVGILVTNDGMISYLQHIQVLQVIQLFQDSTVIHDIAKNVCCIYQHSHSVVEVPEDRLLHEESWTGLQKDINPTIEPELAALCKEEYNVQCHGNQKWPPVWLVVYVSNKKRRKWTSQGLHQAPVRFTETCAHSPGLYWLISIYQRTPE